MEEDSQILITDNEVHHNYAADGGEGIHVYAGDHSTAPATSVEIVNNSVYHNYDDSSMNGIIMGIGVWSMGGTFNASIINNTVYDHLSLNDRTFGILLQYAQDSTIEENFIFNNRGVDVESAGLSLFGNAGNISVNNNIIVSNALDGIHCLPGGGQTDITNNTIVDNSLVGIRELVSSGTSEVFITNCIVGDWDSGTGAADLRSPEPRLGGSAAGGDERDAPGVPLPRRGGRRGGAIRRPALLRDPRLRRRDQAVAQSRRDRRRLG